MCAEFGLNAFSMPCGKVNPHFSEKNMSSLEAIFRSVDQTRVREAMPQKTHSDLHQIVSDVLLLCERTKTRLIIPVGMGEWKRDEFVQLVKQRKTTVVASADAYFMRDGEYRFDARRLTQAHIECQTLCKKTLHNNSTDLCVIANQNCKLQNIRMYADMRMPFVVVVFMPDSSTTAISLSVNNCKGVPANVYKSVYEDMQALIPQLTRDHLPKLTGVFTCTV